MAACERELAAVEGGDYEAPASELDARMDDVVRRAAQVLRADAQWSQRKAAEVRGQRWLRPWLCADSSADSRERRRRKCRAARTRRCTWRAMKWSPPSTSGGSSRPSTAPRTCGGRGRLCESGRSGGGR